MATLFCPGTNLQALIEQAKLPSSSAEIVLVISNRPGVLGLKRATLAGIQARVQTHTRANAYTHPVSDLRFNSYTSMCYKSKMRFKSNMRYKSNINNRSNNKISTRGFLTRPKNTINAPWNKINISAD